MKVLNIGLYHSGLLSLVLGGIIGCTPLNPLGLAQNPVIPINELQQHQQSSEKTDSSTQEAIYLQGTVVDNAPFMDNGSYQLQDDTGTIWVLTQGNLPKVGDQITIKGQIAYQSIAIGGQDVGELYVLEVEQLDAQTQSPAPQVKPVSSPQLDPAPNPEAKPKPKPELDINDLLLPHKSNSK